MEKGKREEQTSYHRGKNLPLHSTGMFLSLRMLLVLFAISTSLALSYWWPYTLFSGSSSGDDTSFCSDPHLMGLRLSILLPEGYAKRS